MLDVQLSDNSCVLRRAGNKHFTAHFVRQSVVIASVGQGKWLSLHAPVCILKPEGLMTRGAELGFRGIQAREL